MEETSYEFSNFLAKMNKFIATDIDDLLAMFTVCEISDTKINENEKRYTHETANICSCIYLLLDEQENVIYVGETRESVRHRLYSDGSGSHYKNDWFKDVKKVKYYRNAEMDWRHRLVIESILVMKYMPKHNLSKAKKERVSE